MKIYDANGTIILEIRSITSWQPSVVVNNELLGDDYVGVLVVKMLCDIDICQSHFPRWMKGYDFLVK